MVLTNIEASGKPDGSQDGCPIALYGLKGQFPFMKQVEQEIFNLWDGGFKWVQVLRQIQVSKTFHCPPSSLSMEEASGAMILLDASLF